MANDGKHFAYSGLLMLVFAQFAEQPSILAGKPRDLGISSAMGDDLERTAVFG